MKALRDWQKQLFTAWANNGYWGIAHCRTGSGKTIAGVSVIDQYTQMYPFCKILVIVPSAKIGEQWKQTMAEQGVTEVPIMSYQQAINKMHRGGLKADCLILDECHRISPEKQSSQVMKLNPDHVLGLSATPGGSVQTLGKPFYTVDWDEANLCPFYVHYATFRPTDYEMKRYDDWSTKMRRVAGDCSNGKATSLPPGRSPRYDQLVRLRRDCCYTMKSRIKHAVDLIKLYNGRRTVVYAERNEQLFAIRDELLKEGINASIYSQEANTLSDFESHRTNILLLCKKLREGWNDVTLEIEILVAPTTRELSHTQVVGRVCRQDPNNPNKKAHIFALLASGTSDENLSHNNDFPRASTETVAIERIMDIAPGLTDRQMCNVLW